MVLFDDLHPTTKRPIVMEDYNELVFVDPNPTMHRLLTGGPYINEANAEVARENSSATKNQDQTGA